MRYGISLLLFATLLFTAFAVGAQTPQKCVCTAANPCTVVSDALAPTTPSDAVCRLYTDGVFTASARVTSFTNISFANAASRCAPPSQAYAAAPAGSYGCQITVPISKVPTLGLHKFTMTLTDAAGGNETAPSPDYDVEIVTILPGSISSPNNLRINK